MKKMKYLRTWLVVALVVTIVGSLTGGTVAWFTDTVESTNNVIQAGNLDMVVEFKNTPDGEWTELIETSKLFNEDALWEPGHTESVALRITNKGSLAFKYDYALNVISETPSVNVYGDEFKLSDSLELLYSAIQDDNDVGAIYMDLLLGSRSYAQGSGMVMNEGEFGTFVVDSTAHLLPGQSFLMGLTVYMPTTVGNEANHQTGAVVPKIEFGLTARATQYMHEEDSFGNNYDADAEYPTVGTDSTLPKAVMKELEGEELNIKIYHGYDDAIVGNVNGAPVPEDEITLDCGVVLSATETDVGNSEYEKYFVDLVISADRAITAADEIILAGHYDFLALADSGEWIAADVTGMELDANTKVRVMQELLGNPMRYDEIVNSVKEFFCGIKVGDSLKGVTFTLELCIYDEFDYAYENPHVVKTYSYTHN